MFLSLCLQLAIFAGLVIWFDSIGGDGAYAPALMMLAIGIAMIAPPLLSGFLTLFQQAVRLCLRQRSQ